MKNVGRLGLYFESEFSGVSVDFTWTEKARREFFSIRGVGEKLSLETDAPPFRMGGSREMICGVDLNSRFGC